MSFPYIVADLGGTNVRFGYVSGEVNSHGQFAIDHHQAFKCLEFDNFDSALKHYLKKSKIDDVHHACIAVAGPVIDEQVSMTNLDWQLRSDSICRDFNFKHLELINDFTAQAYSVLYLSDNQIQTLFAGNAASAADSNCKVAIGPGTGLGVAGLVRNHGEWFPLSSEGGHISVAPQTTIEIEILKVLGLPNSRVSVENLLSGPGLINIYNSVCKINGSKKLDLSPADISSKALNNDNRECIVTIETFCNILGSYAGDIALVLGATGGVYLTGGILPKLSSFFSKTSLIERYLDKGAQRSYIEQIPLTQINSEYTALTGAAHWLNTVLI